VPPGETAVIIGGVLAARRGTVDLAWLTLAVVVAAVAGDSIGYEIGRRLGPPPLGSRSLLRRRAERVDRGRALLRRRGPAAVFVGRFVGLFRSLVPVLAGAARMPYRRFLLSAGPSPSSLPRWSSRPWSSGVCAGTTDPARAKPYGQADGRAVTRAPTPW
jgi:membrane protein DedA with SNARE-associated domain